MAARTKKDEKKAAVKQLLDLRKEQERLQTELADINSRMPAVEAKVSEMLGAGLHTFGKWVVNIYSKKTGGRSTPSWKAIAESAKSAIDYWQNKATEEYPDAAQALGAYADQMRGAWERAKADNTKAGAVKHTTVVEMTKADTTA